MRNITAQMIEEYSGPSVTPIIMGEFYFDSGPLYMWTGIGDLVWGEKTYTGGGSFIGISPIDETEETEAKGIVVSLNGIPSILIALTLTERSRGRPMRLYLASATTDRFVATESGGTVLTEDGGRVLLENTLVNSPYRIFSGIMDTIEFTDNGEKADIRMNVENALIIGQRAKLHRYTSEDQKKMYPEDLGMDLINQLQDKELVW